MAVLLAATALAATAAGGTQAQADVPHPIPLHLSWERGVEDVGSQKGVVAINPETPVTMTGEIGDPSFTIPPSGIEWPPQQLTKPIPATSETEVTGPLTGTYDAATGQMSLTGTFTFYSDNALTKKCKIGPVDLTLSTESMEPYAGERFLSGPDGHGSIATRWDSLPAPEPAEAGANCAPIQKLTEAPGGLWISHEGQTGECAAGGCPCPVAVSDCLCSGACRPPRSELRVAVAGPRSVIGGERARLRVRLENRGTATASGLRICLAARRLLKSRRCRLLSSLAPGQEATRALVVGTHRVRRARSYRLVVSVTGASPTSFELRVKPALRRR